MAHPFQVTIDGAGPRALGAFWCEVLGYIEQPPPPGFDTWDDALDAFGIDRSDPDRAYAIVDPEGKGPRVFFQKVPEGKTAKNRVHLDVNVGGTHARQGRRARVPGRHPRRRVRRARRPLDHDARPRGQRVLHPVSPWHHQAQSMSSTSVPAMSSVSSGSASAS